MFRSVLGRCSTWIPRTSSPRSTARPDRASTRCGSRRMFPSRQHVWSRSPTEELPGVVVAVETRREYPDGPLLAHILGYTGPIDPDTYERLRDGGYLQDDMIGKAGVEATFEEELRGTYGKELVERDATGRDIQILRTIQEAVPGASLDAHDRQDDPEAGDAGAQVGHEGRRPQARRVHRHEPADRRGPRARQPAYVRQQPVRERHLEQGLRRSSSRTRTSPSPTTRSRRITRPAPRTSSSPAPVRWRTRRSRPRRSSGPPAT